MPAPCFHVQLRLWPHDFAAATWQERPEDELAAYLAFYGLAGAEEKYFGAVKAGWVHQEQQRCWLQAYQPELTAGQMAAGTLVHLHGYYDHGGLYPHLQRWALQQRLYYLALDLPGHGLSAGPRAVIRDFSEYQACLHALVDTLKAQKLPRPWLLTGFSTGGAIALEHCLSNPCFDRFALLAPLVRPVGWQVSRRWLPLLSLFLRHLPRKFRDNTRDAAFLELVRNRDPLQARRLPLVWVRALNRWIKRVEKAPAAGGSVLVVQGDQDTTVDWQYNLSVLHRLLPEAQVALIEGAGHQLLNETAEYRQQVLQQLEKGLLAN